MRLAAGDARTIDVDALMSVDHLHAGRLSDDDSARTWQVLTKAGDQRTHAGAANLLVIGDDDVHWLFERSHLEERHRGKNAGEKAFHVAAAASVELAVACREREGIGGPALAFDRHAIAMTREANAAVAASADGGEEVGLDAIGRGDAQGPDAVALEIVLDEGNQSEVRFRARRVESDKRRQQLAHFGLRRRQGNSCELGSGSR